ncbi:hypothetical protein Strop_2493 [Salinispora tropica CNB-440]|uniref:Uncharacterized protein n=1 Tax=Salinispora tropica (strain ATCC BAA-916 / DSM 44818 / JCM 13857 / NBRC 105044 / CNB-440) TaxID=369723 RepID=A4X7T9_SALTO|nr:hypothetical protein Strop_2493 [Salinispora tropica CNB-440]
MSIRISNTASASPSYSNRSASASPAARGSPAGARQTTGPPSPQRAARWPTTLFGTDWKKNSGPGRRSAATAARTYVALASSPVGLTSTIAVRSPSGAGAARYARRRHRSATAATSGLNAEWTNPGSGGAAPSPDSGQAASARTVGPSGPVTSHPAAGQCSRRRTRR